MARLMTACVVASVAVLAGSVSGDAQPQAPSATDKVRITGWALNLSNIATGANQTIQIDIDGWSNVSQRSR